MTCLERDELDTTRSGVLLTYEGEGHTAFLRDGCVDAAITAYLVDGVVPDDGTRCPG